MAQKPVRPAALLAWVREHVQPDAAPADTLTDLHATEEERERLQRGLAPFHCLGSVRSVRRLGARALVVFSVEREPDRALLVPGVVRGRDAWVLRDAAGRATRLAVLIDLAAPGATAPAERRLLWTGDA